MCQEHSTAPEQLTAVTTVGPPTWGAERKPNWNASEGPPAVLRVTNNARSRGITGCFSRHQHSHSERTAHLCRMMGGMRWLPPRWALIHTPPTRVGRVSSGPLRERWHSQCPWDLTARQSKNRSRCAVPLRHLLAGWPWWSDSAALRPNFFNCKSLVIPSGKIAKRIREKMWSA